MNKIRFGTDGWRGIIAYDYTRDNLARITQGTVEWLKKNYNSPQAMVGYDCRFQGKMFAETVACVMASSGVKVFLSPGIASTPMVSLATVKRQANAGIVITASHNPPEYSGYKVKGEFGGPAVPAALSLIEAEIPDEVPAYSASLDAHLRSGMIEYYDMEALYLNHIRQSFDLAKIKSSGLKIGYDAMYGAGLNIFRKILPQAQLLHCEVNPSFHGVPPEPIERNLGEFSAFVRDNGLDVGLATDGDADRIGLMDSDGNFVDSHHIFLLLIRYLVKEKKMNGKAVYSFSLSEKVGKLCRMYGIPTEVTRIGFKYVSEIMLKEDVMVGGEESGGLAVAGHIPERDGIYIGLMILEMMAVHGKSLKGLVQEVYDEVGAFSYNRKDLHLEEEKKQAIVNLCKSGGIDSFGAEKVLRTEDLDGFKYHLADEQWVMIRASGTEPVLRIYAESPTRDRVNLLLENVVETLMRKTA